MARAKDRTPQQSRAKDGMQRHYRIIRKPLITEKGTEQQADTNAYHFMVDPHANKVQIKQAIEKIFSVEVKRVNTMMKRGKRLRRWMNVGKKRDWKKAIVTLKEGQAIEFI